MTKKIFIIFLIFAITLINCQKNSFSDNSKNDIHYSNHKNILNRYETLHFDETDSIIPNHYTGPLFMSGCANSDINKMLREETPTKIGHVDTKKITLFGDNDYPEEVYNFDSISYYEVSINLDTFYIIYLEAQKDSIDYEIIIELKAGDNYDRTINIYKKGKLSTVILWVENMRIKPKGKDI